VRALLTAIGVLAAVLAVAAPAAARPARGSPGGFRPDALLCRYDVDARLRVWWTDAPGDPDAPAGVDGSCATVPAWVVEVGAGGVVALDVAAGMGFALPPPDGTRGGDGRYDVYVLDLGARDQGLLGLAEPDGTGRTSSLLVDESYVDELPPGWPTSPLDELRVTVAHELFHAVQFGMGATELPAWILEGTAVWFESRAQPGIPDNLGYLARHLTGDRGRLPLWAEGGCGSRCWPAGLPHDAGHVYATWLFFWSAADERGDPDLVRRLLGTLANTRTPDDLGLAALWRATGGDLAVRLREYGLGLLLRRRVGPYALPPSVAGGPAREPGAAPGRPASGRLWPLQPLLVPVAPGDAVVVRTSPLPARAIRRALALVTAEGAVLRLPRVDREALIFDLPAGSAGGTLVLAAARPAWPLAYTVRVVSTARA
jgi:hypothetical protein